MRYKQLGSTGTLVSEICLGTMTFGGRGFWTAIGTLDQSVADGIVVGAKTIEQLDDNLAATDVKLSDEELAQLDLVSALPPEYPGWIIQRQTADQQR